MVRVAPAGFAVSVYGRDPVRPIIPRYASFSTRHARFESDNRRRRRRRRRRRYCVMHTRILYIIVLYSTGDERRTRTLARARAGDIHPDIRLSVPADRRK